MKKVTISPARDERDIDFVLYFAWFESGRVAATGWGTADSHLYPNTVRTPQRKHCLGNLAWSIGLSILHSCLGTERETLPAVGSYRGLM